MSVPSLNSERTVEFVAISNYSRNVNTLNNLVVENVKEIKSLDSFISKYRLSKTDSSKPNVTSPRGRFLIPDHASANFFSLLSSCFAKKVVLHFRELQATDYDNKLGSGLMFDFDILQNHNKNLMESNDLQGFIKRMMRVIAGMLEINGELDTYVAIIAKPEIVEKEKDKVWKNGFHVLIPNVWLAREQKKLVVQEILNDEQCNKLFFQVFEVDLVKAFDTQCASVPVYFLHNCKEDCSKPYFLKTLYEYNYSDGDVSISTINDEVVGINQELSLTFPSCGKAKKFYDFNAKFKSKLKSRIKEANAFEDKFEEVENVFATANINADENLEYYKKLVMEVLLPFRAEERQHWRDVVFALASIGKGRLKAFKALAKMFSMRCKEKYSDEAFETLWAQATDSSSDKKLTMSSLIFWCKQDNQALYESLEQSTILTVIEKDVFHKHPINDGTLFESQFAYYLYHMFKQKFVCDYENERTKWYEFVLQSDDYTKGQLYKWREEPRATSLHLYLREKMSDLVCMVLKKAEARIETLEDDELIGYIQDRMNKLRVSARKLNTNIFKENIIREAMSLFHTRGFIDSLDEDEAIMGVGNGILVLNGGVTLRQGYHEYRVSMFSPVNYSPFDINSDASRVMLKAIMGMFPPSEMDMFHYIMYFFSTSLDNRPKDSMFLILQGTGSNGKSSLLEFVTSVIGSYGTKVNISALTDQKRTAASSANEQLMALKRARLAFYSETNKQEEINCATAKELTSQESISCRGIYQKQQTFRPKCNHVITTNYPPIIKTTDYGIWRRMKLYNFKMSFVPESEMNHDDPNMRIADETIAKEFSSNNRSKEVSPGLLVENYKDLAINHKGKIAISAAIP